MNHDQNIWDIARFILELIGGAVAGLIGAMKWFASHEKEINKHLKAIDNSLHEAETKVAVLQAESRSKLERLARMEHCLDRLMDKQDKQLGILDEIMRRGK